MRWLLATLIAFTFMNSAFAAVTPKSDTQENSAIQQARAQRNAQIQQEHKRWFLHLSKSDQDSAIQELKREGHPGQASQFEQWQSE
jgi:hypothetical protein